MQYKFRSNSVQWEIPTVQELPLGSGIIWKTNVYTKFIFFVLGSKYWFKGAVK